MKDIDIVIYDLKNDLPVHIVDTIEKAAAWIGCARRMLYHNMHISGLMHANGYYIERVKRI